MENDSTASLIVQRDQLRTVAKMALEQFEFLYGNRGRGWDSVFLMKRLREVLNKSEYSLYDKEREAEHQ